MSSSKNQSYNMEAIKASSSQNLGDSSHHTEHSSSARVVEVQPRDEVKELEKFTQKDSRRVFIGRILVTVLLAAMGVAVCVTSYTLLVDQEETNFEQAYDEFSRTLSDATVSEIHRLQEAATTFGITLESTTALMQQTCGAPKSSAPKEVDPIWPYYDYPDISRFAEQEWRSKRLESIQYLARVKHQDRHQYMEWQGQIVERWVTEGHMRAYGNLDNLVPAGYMNDILEVTDEGVLPSTEKEEYWPLAFRMPPPNSYFVVGLDISSINYDDLFTALKTLGNQTLLSNINPYIESDDAERRYHEQFHSELPDSQASYPHSFLCHPVNDAQKELIGVVLLPVAWDSALRNLLPSNVQGINVIVENSAGQAETYRIAGKDAFYLGPGDLHEKRYDGYRRSTTLYIHDTSRADFAETRGHYIYSMSIYPSDEFKEDYTSKIPLIFVLVMAATFFLMILVFYTYDWFVQRRNKKLLMNAARSNEIVSSMFPGQLRDKIVNTTPDDPRQNLLSPWSKRVNDALSNHSRHGQEGKTIAFDSPPLAELHPEATVLFADIVGFTAWSSVREPTQVFRLLETVYSAFDDLARCRGVFKVETVGDCYVAACGLPDRQEDHAMRMCRYASSLLVTFASQAKKLEVTLGPDTGDLALRIGIHSGQVTAGVLRTDRARFQLFGDTMNVCARIETAGQGGRVHVSHETAEELVRSGKSNWLQKREDTVIAKGKGDMHTYWLTYRSVPRDVPRTSSKLASGEFDESESSLVPDFAEENEPKEYDRSMRLVDWNVSTLLNLLKQIVARREERRGSSMVFSPPVDESSLETKDTFLEEVKEIIHLPEYRASRKQQRMDPSKIQMDPAVAEELRDYVQCIANLYRENPFHNFEHASHVAMSVQKLLSRIVAPSHLDLPIHPGDEPEQAPPRRTKSGSLELMQQRRRSSGDASLSFGSSHHQVKDLDSHLHDHTYGITSDPLTQFVCVLSAMIHDVDHTGVANTRLMEENPAMAKLYKNRSVAEQNSLAISWALLMDKRFATLRSVIYTNVSESQRFRELLVNSVMATDIMDKDLKQMRNNRWDKAFHIKHQSSESSVGSSETFAVETEDAKRDDVNRKATIVIEHLIQASDVSHTMQHWHVYRKWNGRLFAELYQAYKEGRAEKNPAEFWAKGEIGFFDFYVIPLAKKLKDCGVFGVSSAEYLGYAEKWLEHGDNVVAEMVERLQNEPAGNEEGHSQRNRIMRTPSVRNTCWEDEPLSSSEGEK